MTDKVLVTMDEAYPAYTNWKALANPKNSDINHATQFWQYIMADTSITVNTYPGLRDGGFLLPQAAADRIVLLNSPHRYALMKAAKARKTDASD